LAYKENAMQEILQTAIAGAIIGGIYYTWKKSSSARERLNDKWLDFLDRAEQSITSFWKANKK